MWMMIMNDNVDHFDERDEGIEGVLKMNKTNNGKTGDEDELDLEFTPLDEMVILMYKLASTIHATAVIHSVCLW